jgi:hypothetical protein
VQTTEKIEAIKTVPDETLTTYVGTIWWAVKETSEYLMGNLGARRRVAST